MPTLMVAVFKHNVYRATHVLDLLMESESGRVFEPRDVAAICRTASGKLRVDQSLQMPRDQTAAYSSLWRSLIALIFGQACSTGITTIVVADTLIEGILGDNIPCAVFATMDASQRKDTFGISDDFIGEIRDMVQPGDSAIFTLIGGVDPSYVAELFHVYGGMVLQSPVSPNQIEMMKLLCDGKRQSAS